MLFKELTCFTKQKTRLQESPFCKTMFIYLRPKIFINKCIPKQRLQFRASCLVSIVLPLYPRISRRRTCLKFRFNRFCLIGCTPGCLLIASRVPQGCPNRFRLIGCIPGCLLVAARVPKPPRVPSPAACPCASGFPVAARVPKPPRVPSLPKIVVWVPRADTIFLIIQYL